MYSVHVVSDDLCVQSGLQNNSLKITNETFRSSKFEFQKRVNLEWNLNEFEAKIWISLFLEWPQRSLRSDPKEWTL